jgi:hypothetical protein
VLLIRGCPRSGTTLLVNILNQNDDIGIFNEYALGDLVHDLAPIFQVERDHGDLEVVAVRAAGAVGSDAIPDVYIHPFENPFVTHQLRFPTRERMAALVTGVVEASLEKDGLRVIGSKRPGPAENGEAARLERAFARVQYLFVVRNPLDTINSIINRRNRARVGWDTWAIDTVDAAIREYRDSMTLLLSLASAHPDDVFVVGYEDLVENFAATAAQIGSFLGVSLTCDPRITEIELHRKSILTPDEEQHVRGHFGALIDNWRTRRISGPAPLVAASLAEHAETMKDGIEYRYGASSPQRRFLGLGWDIVEDEAVWSNAESSDVIFRAASEGPHVLRLNVSFFLPMIESTVPLTVEVNGHEVFRAVFYHADRPVIDATTSGLSLYPGRGNTDVWCGPVEFSAGTPNVVRLRFGSVRSPAELGINGDERTLAVALHAISLQPAGAA